LNQINSHAGQLLTISAPMAAVLRAALKAAQQTNGLVTPTILNALEAAGYDRSFEQISAAAKYAGGKYAGDQACWRQIELDGRARTLRLPPGMRLDLGGIAKGWAADQIRRKLAQFSPLVVDAGGDIAVSERRAGAPPWQIGIADPRHAGQHLLVLSIRRGGVATSGRNDRQWQQGAKHQHHLIDPRSGQPAETDVLAASVVAPSALQAEISAKAILILGSRAGMAWLAARPQLAGLLVLEDGRVLVSRRLSAYSQ
jgi:thiamine biosynthesis lipoprotein